MSRLQISIFIAVLPCALLLAQVPPPPPPAAGSPAIPVATIVPAATPVANPAAVEVQRVEERIASAQRDTLARYDSALQDLQVALQKAADLEGALTVRAERKRALESGTLTEANFVAEPKTLRALQMQMATRTQDLVSQLVQETLPRLIELKKQLTIAGRLDEAVAVRTSVERLQNNFLPVVRAETGSVVPVETILRAYAMDRPRGDATYKGQRITLRGTVAGFRQDPADARNYLVYVASGNATSGYVQCTFGAGENKFREEKQFNAQFLYITPKDNDSPARLQRGSAIDVSGVCAGWDETLRLTRCEIAR